MASSARSTSRGLATSESWMGGRCASSTSSDRGTMARVLALSSQVARGHVGLSAVVPALQRLGHEVWPLPTILLSNHPGHAHAAGLRVDPAALEEMVDAL